LHRAGYISHTAVSGRELDDLRIFKKGLTPEEVQILYTNTAEPPPVPAPNPQEVLAAKSGGYRYGFQGQERMDEVKGAGNSWDYKYRMHDPRLGRFFAVDPLFREYSYNSVYAFSENSVIAFIELEGLEKVEYWTGYGSERKMTETFQWNKVTDQTKEAFLRKHDVEGWFGSNYHSDAKIFTGSNTEIWTFQTDWDEGTRSTIFTRFSNDGKIISSQRLGGVWSSIETLLTGHNNLYGEYNGTLGMYEAADDLDYYGDKASSIPTPATQVIGKYMSGKADVLRSIADYNTLESETATKNLLVRSAAYVVGEKVSKDIKAAEFNITKDYIYQETSRKVLDEIKNEATTKPK
jgi:RHS repeat-associated protein